MIRSISYCQEDIIASVLKLHSPGGIDLDPTFSKGKFYGGKIKRPAHVFDIQPQADGVIKACASDLPLDDESIGCTMFDPPFLATKGPSLATPTQSNLIASRFGVYPNEGALHLFYSAALKEIYRVTKKGGTLIFKCQDKVSSGKQYFSHVYIYEQAKSAGWYARDLFVLLAKSRMIPKWHANNQKHARKYHSYFWVFQKLSKVSPL